MPVPFRTLLISAAVLLLACAGVCAQAPSATTPGKTAGATPAPPDAIRARFTCKDGRKIQAIFTPGAHSSVALTLSDGRQLALPQALSGSGARYANPDESFVFWNKGRTAFITESGKRTYDGCVQER
jgi:membrane-bound inhibitor of C-type lysozyme